MSTIARGIIAPEDFGDSMTFIWAMLAALLSAALWVNLATWLSAPVSTTHSVVGGVMGAGIAAAGFAVVNWSTMGAIAASWVISPVLGGAIAAGFLWFIENRITHQGDKIAAARVWVPVLVGIMAGAFAAYLSLKGLDHLIDVSLGLALVIGLAVGVGTWLGMIPMIRRQSRGLENRNRSLKVLFAVPLVVSAALLSFAHGANDVANAVGPLAAIVQASQDGGFGGEVAIPFWVMLIGAFGISFGLFLFGPKLIRMVGSEITKLNPMRAYCVALSAAITVIVGKLARPAGQLDPHRSGRGLRRGLLPRVGRRAPSGRRAQFGRPPGARARGAAAPQARSPVALPDHHRSLDRHGACRGASVGSHLPRHHRLRGLRMHSSVGPFVLAYSSISHYIVRYRTNGVFPCPCPAARSSPSSGVVSCSPPAPARPSP